jgi:hypothetical protein
MKMIAIASITAVIFVASQARAVEAAPNLSQAQQGAMSVQADPGEGVANLPYARGRRFKTLDEYLAHLEELGAVDLPWWREISPGVYEHVIRMPNAKRETATREELMRRWGFTR